MYFRIRTPELFSHWVPLSYGLVPHLSKMLSKVYFCLLLRHKYVFNVISSSSSCHTASMGFPDSLSSLSLSLSLSLAIRIYHLSLLADLLDYILCPHRAVRSVLVGPTTLARLCKGVHGSTSLMISSLLLQQCPACLDRLIRIVSEYKQCRIYSCNKLHFQSHFSCQNKGLSITQDIFKAKKGYFFLGLTLPTPKIR